MSVIKNVYDDDIGSEKRGITGTILTASPWASPIDTPIASPLINKRDNHVHSNYTCNNGFNNTTTPLITLKESTFDENDPDNYYLNKGHHSAESLKLPNENPVHDEELGELENYPGFYSVVFKYFPQTRHPRDWCLRIITWSWFERISMMVILLNCITLGMHDTCSSKSCTTSKCIALDIVDNIIFTFFFLEMLIKITAMGLTGDLGYLGDSWNRLDFFIVLAGIFDYIPNSQNLSMTAIRAIRVLRPLRAINRIPSMRILVMLLLDTLPMLGNVLLLCFFVFFIFGIIAVQMWAGELRNRCYLSIQVPPEVNIPPYYKLNQSVDLGEVPKEFICAKPDSNGMLKCSDIKPSLIWYNNTPRICTANYSPELIGKETPDNCINWGQYYNECRSEAKNPYKGAINFDQIGAAWVAIFQVISMESWVEIMYYVQDAHSFWDWIYFVALIVIGAFFMINLCLVVIATQFSETKKREIERMALERRRYQSNSTLISSLEPKNCYGQLFRIILSSFRKISRWAIKRVLLVHYRITKNDKYLLRLDRLNVERRLNNRQSYLHDNHPNAMKPKCVKKYRNYLSSLSKSSYSNIKPSTDPNHPQSRPGLSLISTPYPFVISMQNNNASVDLSYSTDSNQNYGRRRSQMSLQYRYPTANSSTSERDNHTNGFRKISIKCIEDDATTINSVFQHAPVATPEMSEIDLYDSNGSMMMPFRSTNLSSISIIQNNEVSRSSFLQEENSSSPIKQNLLHPESILYSSLVPPNRSTESTSPKYYCTTNGQVYRATHIKGKDGKTFKAFIPCYSAVMPNQKAPLSFPVQKQEENNFDYLESCSDLECKCHETESTKKLSRYKQSKKFLQMIRTTVKNIVDHPYFSRTILFSILVNTISMGIEYHEQPEELTIFLEKSNMFFTLLFLIEMILKLIGDGIVLYLSDGFNVFDGIIVTISVCEITDISSTSGLSVLRTFRLLRIIKLVRFLPALKKQLVVMLKTMDNVATFFALLVLFIFIFSILGRTLFGGKFCTRTDLDPETPCTCVDLKERPHLCECDRSNFDELHWALVTVFQILTQEDWNTVLYTGMERTSSWAALYFIALMTFGNYVLFNLLVAILVEGFSSEEDQQVGSSELRVKSKSENGSESSLEKSNDEESQSESVQIDKSNTKEFWKNAIRKKFNLKPKGTEAESARIIENKESTKEDAPELDCYSETSKDLIKPPIIMQTEPTPMNTPIGSRKLLSKEEDQKSENSKTNILRTRSFVRRSFSNSEDPENTSDKTRKLCLKTYRAENGEIIVLFMPQNQIPGNEISPNNNFTTSAGSKHRSSISQYSKIVQNDSVQDSTKTSQDLTTDRNNSYDYQKTSFESMHSTLNPDQTISIRRSSDQFTPLLKRNAGFDKFHHNNVRKHRSSSVAYPFITTVGNAQYDNPFRLRRLLSQTPSRRISTISLQNQYFDFEGLQGTKKASLPTSADSKYEECIANINESPINSSRTNDAHIEVYSNASEIDRKDMICFSKYLPKPRGIFADRYLYSCYVFSPENRFRLICQRIASSRIFDYIILSFIVFNCITLAMERPSIPEKSLERHILTTFNYLFTLIFTIEMIIKVTAKGFLIDDDSYLRSGWNIMDGCLVAVSLIDLLSILFGGYKKIFGILRVFRLLRTLKPLRVISRAPGLKLVVQTLLSSLRPIGNIVLICWTFFIIFGILGVQLFKGKLYYCEGPEIQHVKTRQDCEKDPRNKWINQQYNFDNLFKALMTLFVLSSKDGWVQIMHNGLDAVGIDMQPIKNYNEWYMLYFISFLLLVGFFALNMFVGVVVDNFHKCRENQEKEEKARRALKKVKQLEKRTRKKNKEPYWIKFPVWRKRMLIVVTDKYFDLAIAAIIGVNVITMATEFYNMPAAMTLTLKIFNYFFTLVFIAEAVIKMVALGFMKYMKDRWNQLDIGIVIFSIIGVIFDEMNNDVLPFKATIIRVMRVLRIARVLKLLKMAKGIRELLDTVIQALPQVGNLGLLFFLLFFIFAALGVELFGRLECNLTNPCIGLNDRHANFKHFGMAFFTLFRIATGDNWNAIMSDTLRSNCDPSENCIRNCCPIPYISQIYFIVFVLLAQFVLVNVVVAVLMKHLEEAQHKITKNYDSVMESHRTLCDDDELERDMNRIMESDGMNFENANMLQINIDAERENYESMDVSVDIHPSVNDNQNDLPVILINNYEKRSQHNLDGISLVEFDERSSKINPPILIDEVE